MVLYNMYIYNRKGICLFYKEVTPCGHRNLG